MSLFDYHGRFSRSHISNKNPQDSGEDYLTALEVSLKDDQKEEKKTDPEESTRAESSEELEITNDSDRTDEIDEPEGRDDSKKSTKSEQSDAASEEQSDDVGKAEQSESSEDSKSSRSLEKPDGSRESSDVAVADNAAEQEDAEKAHLDADDAVHTQDVDAERTPDAEGSTEERAQQKKKTPALQGKHAANASSLSSEEGEPSSPRRTRRALKGFGIAACALLVTVALVYGAGVLVFTNRILPNTVVSSHDISLRTNEEAVQLLQSIESNYALETKMGTFDYRVTKDEIGLTLDAQAIVDAIHEKYEAFKWPLYLFDSSHDTSGIFDVVFDPAGYEQDYLDAVTEYNKTALPPTDAFIYYDENAQRFLIQDEVMGTQIDPSLSLTALTLAIRDLQPVLRLTEAELVQPKVRSNDEFLIESAKLATSLISTKISLLVNDEVVRTIGPADLSGCILINDKHEVSFDEKAFDELCNRVADEFTTIGAERAYTRPDGKEVTVKGGSYGWAVDKGALKDQLLEIVKQGESATIAVPFETTAEVYVAPGQRDWGNRYIDIDLSEQHVRLYDEEGTLVWETDCITGSPDGYHNTPQGVWRINDMESPSRLVGYEGGKQIYVSYVTYWMPFIRNSIGLHDATWQPAFGGSMYANGYGSHGCVNLSYKAAQELWNLVRVGDVVVTHF